MTDTYDVPDITQAELKQLVSQYTSCIAKAEQAVISEDRVETHGPGVKKSFVTEVAQRSMTMDNLDLFSDENLAQDREGGEDSRECG